MFLSKCGNKSLHSDYDSPEAGANIKDVSNIASVLDRHIVNDLEIRKEVKIPATIKEHVC